MTEVTGEFEIHLTVPDSVGRLEEFARQHGLKFTHIELDRGSVPSQPMITITGRGTLSEQRELAWSWLRRYFGGKPLYSRMKIEAAPWNAGVPQTEAQAQAEPPERYFEHHLKLVLPDASDGRLAALTELVEQHQARLSRNARRKRADRVEERFVTQRCQRIGRATAQLRLDALAAELRARGYEIAEIEQEYVVVDNGRHYDGGWLSEGTQDALEENIARHAREGIAGYPPTYRPVPVHEGVWHRAAFDPALKHFFHAYRAGEPQFADAAVRQRWYTARLAAMAHLLELISDSEWAGSLVLRGSVVLRAWVGEAAREPGDLDFVVIPHSIDMNGHRAGRMLDGIVAAAGERPGAGLRADDVAAVNIWTYERAPGRRLTFPFVVQDLPRGTVQLDFVFNEMLPVPPEMVQIPLIGKPVLAANAQLSLAWKLLWLDTDMWPQGKDLYDATLLAEHTPISPELLRDVLRSELGGEADSFTASSVLRWEVDWENFREEYPTVQGDAASWQSRLAEALARSIGR